MQFTINLKAGRRHRQQTAGRLFIIRSATSAADVWLYKGQEELESIDDATTGFKARVPDQFSHVELQSPIDATLVIVISGGMVDFDFITGTTINATVNGPFPLPVETTRGILPGTPLYVAGITYSDVPATALADDVAVAIGPVAAQIVAASATRKALRIANIGTDPMAIGAAGITWAKRCIVLYPGDVWHEDRGANLAWYAITDAAKAASATAQEVIA